jgi:futalosine hydrolase
MPHKILLVAATDAEGDVLRKMPGIVPYDEGFRFGNCDITLLVTGIGQMATSWSLTKWISCNEKPDLAVNIGIAGSYNEKIHIGEVVAPVSDCFADTGVETGKTILTLAEEGIEDTPLREGRIYAENEYLPLILKVLKPVAAITVNTVSGSAVTIERMMKKFHPDIETMEGATFFYICSREKTPFLAIRAISNRVEPRDKEKWNIPLAINNLSERLKDILLMFD